jgi:uncharacterized protein (DUF924 family)
MTKRAANHADYEEILTFWFGELDEHGRAAKASQDRWWSKDPALDAQIRQQFGSTHAALMGGELDRWLACPRARLAYIVVLDQFSRNMFRDTAAMFASDPLALRAALTGIDAGMHRQLKLDERGIFYMPLLHSEELSDQERCVALFLELTNEVTRSARATMLSRVGFAERHRDIVKKFGRFPHRNAVLGRESTPDELEFLAGPGSSF